MASIILTQPVSAGTTINATNKRVPRRLNATTFEDSNIIDSANQTTVYKGSNGNGMAATYSSERVKIGQCLSLGNDTNIEIDNAGGIINFNGAALLGGAPVTPSADGLLLTINGVVYKILLFNP